MVTWEEVPAIDENGIIITYEIEFVPLQFTEILVTGSINTTNLFIDITGLQEYVEYDIRVRAYTSVGPGPFSVAVTNRTFEDGKGTVIYAHNEYLMTVTANMCMLYSESHTYT